MPKLVVEEFKELTLLPVDTIAHLKVDDLSVKEVQGNHGPWQKLEAKFKILGLQVVGDGSNPAAFESVIGSPIWGSVPFRLTDSPENKLRLWAEAILGIELGVGFELDTDLFLRRNCRGIVSQYKKRNGNMAHQIESLLPAAAQGQATPAPQQDPWATPAAQPQGGGFSFANPPQAQQGPTDPWASDEPGF